MKDQLITLDNLPKSFKEWYVLEIRSKRKDYDKFSDDIILRKLKRHPKEILLTYIQKWLREKYQLIVWIQPSALNSTKCFYPKVDNCVGLQNLQYENSFEKALEKGLQEALKIINND